MVESILNTIREMTVGLENGTAFDTDLIVHINAALLTLNQLGVGPSTPLMITGEDETWSDLLGDDLSNLSAVKSYIWLKVKLAFDPPSNSFVNDSYVKMANELEWRMNVQVDPRIQGA